MVTILPPKQNLGTLLGQGFSQGLTGVLNQIVPQQIQRRQVQNALGELKNLPKNASPMDLATALISATAGIPGAERYVGQLFPLLMQQSQANISQNVPTSAELLNKSEPNPFVRAPSVSQAKANAPQFIEGIRQGKTPIEQVAEETGKYIPKNVGSNEPPGNLPQPATAGIARTVLSPIEMVPAAKELAAQRTAAGMPTTVPQALEELKATNEENKLYNASVEEERRQRIESQREYGEKAVEQLKKVYPESTPEQQAIFRKLAEKTAGLEKSEADIEKSLAIEARKFKNNIVNIKEDLSAPRVYKELHRKLLGSEKSFNEAAGDLRVKLKPLLELGLNDTARNLLTDLGYYPEERESVIFPLSDRAKTAINLIPSTKKTFKIDEKRMMPGLEQKFLPGEEIYPPKAQDNIKEGIQEVLKNDPNVSLVLLRKSLEDKGYDWRIFKNALNELINSDQVKLNDDQFQQLIYLDSPPLNNLEKILHGLNLRGR